VTCRIRFPLVAAGTFNMEVGKMIRKLFPLLAVLGVVLASSAQAFPNRQPLRFWTTVANSAASVDSNAASGTVGRADTTGAVEMASWVPLSENFLESAESATIPDTVAFFGLYVFPAKCNCVGNTTIVTGADSIHFIAQVSHDAVNWVTATPTGAAVLGGGALGTVETAVELGSSNTFGYVFDLVSDDTAAGNGISMTLNGTAPADNALYGFRYIRFIFWTDINGAFEAETGFWTHADMH
jgi:hypothetical protein